MMIIIRRLRWIGEGVIHAGCMAASKLENQEELIGLIYESVLCPEAWQKFLDRVVEVSCARSGLLVLQNTDNLDIGYTLQNGFDAPMRELYNRDYRTADLWTIRLAQLPRGQMVPSQRFVPQKEFRRSLIYNEFCRPQGIEHCAGAFITCGGSWSIRFALQRTKPQGEFSDSEIQSLQRLVPHIQRSVRIGGEIGTIRGSLEAIIEQWLTPCMLVSSDRKIVMMNRKAQTLLAHHQLGLVVSHGRIGFKSSELTHRLDALVRDSHRTHVDGQGQGGGIVKLPRKGRLPLMVSVTPFHAPASTGLNHPECTVALFFLRSRSPNLPEYGAFAGNVRADTC